MKTINYTCDICGKERGSYYTVNGCKYRNVYRFKKIDLLCFVSGKSDIEKCDICNECLYKFKNFVRLSAENDN